MTKSRKWPRAAMIKQVSWASTHDLMFMRGLGQDTCLFFFQKPVWLFQFSTTYHLLSGTEGMVIHNAIQGYCICGSHKDCGTFWRFSFFLFLTEEKKSKIDRIGTPLTHTPTTPDQHFWFWLWGTRVGGGGFLAVGANQLILVGLDGELGLAWGVLFYTLIVFHFQSPLLA